MEGNQQQSQYNFGFSSDNKLHFQKNGQDLIVLDKDETKTLCEFLEQIGLCRTQVVYKYVEIPTYPAQYPYPAYPHIIWSTTGGSTVCQTSSQSQEN